MKKYLILTISLVIFGIAQSQNMIDNIFRNKTEVVFSFEESNPQNIATLSKIISIDSRRGSTITAYANRDEFSKFLQLNYDYTIIEKQNNKAISMASSVSDMANWDKYPTYSVYLQMMQNFASNYPNICRIDTIGTSVNGRLMLCAKISDSVNLDQNEPQLLYISTIHGDEVTGYILMLRLIDYLLSNYGTDNEVTNLVDNTQIFINPLFNPDGTYRTSNNSISSSYSTRYNANNVDLNRNYPDHWSSDPISAIQTENRAMINFANNHHFVLAATLHGGAEIFNFPWDAFESDDRKVADYNWWCNVARNFVDTCRLTNSNYYTSDATSGYIAGGDWYVINNGQQDYLTFYNRVRIVTLEVSETKTLSNNKLNTYWNFHKRSLINFIKEIHKGVKGMVIDSVTRQPVEAMIYLSNYDYDSSEVFSRQQGDFYRLLLPGTYTINATAPGYRTKTMNISIGNSDATQIVFELVRDGSQQNISSPKQIKTKIFPNPCKNTIEIDGKKIIGYKIVNTLGTTVLKNKIPVCNHTKINTANLPKGLFFIEIYKANSSKELHKIIKK